MQFRNIIQINMFFEYVQKFLCIKIDFKQLKTILDNWFRFILRITEVSDAFKFNIHEF